MDDYIRFVCIIKPSAHRRFVSTRFDDFCHLQNMLLHVFIHAEVDIWQKAVNMATLRTRNKLSVRTGNDYSQIEKRYFRLDQKTFD